MAQFPDTQHTLIARLRDRDDARAWEEFSALYRPVVYRLARAKGMQDADANELVQETMMAVSRAVDRWDSTIATGRFRNWLGTIAKNLIINRLTRRRYRTMAQADTDAWERLDRIPSADYDQWLQTFETEYRRELLRHVADSIRHEFQENTWNAFWKTSVEGLEPAVVAREQQMSIGSVYIAKSRVMARLRLAVEEFSR